MRCDPSIERQRRTLLLKPRECRERHAFVTFSGSALRNDSYGPAADGILRGSGERATTCRKARAPLAAGSVRLKPTRAVAHQALPRPRPGRARVFGPASEDERRRAAL